MKKLFIAVFALLVVSNVNAQEKSSKGPSFGLKGGVSFSNIIKTDDSDFETNFVTGFNAGVFINVPILDKLAFQPELMFSQKGYMSDRSGILGSGTLTQKTNWIEIPILAAIEAAPNSNSRLFTFSKTSFGV